MMQDDRSDKSRDKPARDQAARPDSEPSANGDVSINRSGDSAPTRPVNASSEVADFVKRMRSMAPATTIGRGRLVFAMDATMSRQPTWDMALALQAEMFHAVKTIGGLDVQLLYFRGLSECRASKWVADPDALARLMTTVQCAGGYTQIGKVLSHARKEAAERRISGLVYVGDCMEEQIDDLCGRAGELALLGVPVFLFQEGHDAPAERAFREIARLTRGAYCRFDSGSASQLKDLLTAVAVYAAGGRKALETLSLASTNKQARALLQQMK
jgi:hypothetical protein